MDKELTQIHYANPAVKRILLKKPQRSKSGSASSSVRSVENDLKAHF